MTDHQNNNNNNHHFYNLHAADHILNRAESHGTSSVQTRIVDNSSFLSFWRGKLRTWSGQVIANDKFQKMIVTMIIINSIIMGMATFDFVTDNPHVEILFEKIDLGFLILFTVEQILHFCDKGLEMFNDGWLLFDFLIISFSWFFATMQIIRAFRIVRVFRLITHSKELSNLVLALLSVIPKMTAVVALLMLLFYIYGVMFTQLFKDLYAEGYTSQDYFSRLDITMFTLFQLMTLDSWSQITKEVMKAYSWAWLLFISFVMISSFVVINLMIAVICDAVSQVEAKRLDELVVQPTIECISASKDEYSTTTTKMEKLEAKIDHLTSVVEHLIQVTNNQQQENIINNNNNLSAIIQEKQGQRATNTF